MLVSLAMVFQGVPFGSAKAGNLDRMDIASESNWQPGSCHTPVPPSTKVYDVVTYNVAVSLFNAYREEVDTYFACASREAESDLTIFRGVLTGSLEGIQTKILSQFEGLKQDLELSRKAFE
jgi:hypothetical protein